MIVESILLHISISAVKRTLFQYNGDSYVTGGDKLLLFDWKGNQVKMIVLPQEHSMITASESYSSYS